MPALRSALVVLLLVAGSCGGEASNSTTTVSVPDYQRAATDYAVSAQRALESTAYGDLGIDRVADVVAGLCDGLGLGAVAATVDGLADGVSTADRSIMVEVIESGVRQTCPDRAALDFAPIYLDSIESVLVGAGVEGFDTDRALRAAPEVCATFADGGTGEAALLVVVQEMFEVRADTAAGLDGLIDGEQGFTAGTVLATATALLCPRYASDVTAFLESL